MGLLCLLIVSSNRLRLSPDEILPHQLLSIKDSPSLLSVEATTLIARTASSSPHLRGSTPHLQDPEWAMVHRRQRPLRYQQPQPPRLPRSPGRRVRLYPVRVGVCLVVIVRATDLSGAMAPGFLRLPRFRRSGWFWRGSLINRK
jgi:hypothetical protein